MGILDRFRRDREPAVPAEPVAPVVLDTTMRVRQLVVLADALDDLAAAMRTNSRQRYNPGWTGRIDEYVAAAEQARALRRDGFDLDALLDLAAEVRPLFVRGHGREPDPAVAALEPLQDQVMAAVSDLRTVRPSERAAPPRPK